MAATKQASKQKQERITTDDCLAMAASIVDRAPAYRKARKAIAEHPSDPFTEVDRAIVSRYNALLNSMRKAKDVNLRVKWSNGMTTTASAPELADVLKDGRKSASIQDVILA